VSDDVIPTVTTVVVDDEFVVHVAVLTKALPSSHLLWQRIPKTVCSSSDLVSLFSVLSKSVQCSAIVGSQFVNAAVRDTDAVSQQPDRLRSRECEQLVFTNGRCEPCCRLRKRLQVRLASRAVKNKTSVNTANKFLSSPLRYSKLKHLARMSTSLKRKNNLLEARLKSFRRTCRQLVEKEGETLSENDNDCILKLASECSEVAQEQFPSDSFQRIFWNQQLQYNSLKNKANMKWHPTIIRWCLFIKSKSSKAYDGMRAYLNLPSTRTLYDYSHYMEHGLGVQCKVLEQLIHTAQNLGCYDIEHKSFVGILHDEIKIKSDLVYNKSTGEIVGYVKLDEVTNELLKLHHTTGSLPAAQYLLVTMVRGITSTLRYPLAAYATNTASCTSLYNIIWECMEYIELTAGLKVLYICCDGAIQNRQFFQLHGTGNELVYKTKNLYASEERDVYFISDPPHLLKTSRNCYANSFAHSDVRHMWFSSNISWAYIEKLYEEKCCKSEYSMCPKLTRQHLQLNTYSKMRVSLAAQVLSATVANALEHCYGDHVAATVRFIRVMNKWFDVLNVKNVYEGKHKNNDDLQPFTDLNDPRLRWLEEDFLNYLDDWKDACKKRAGNFSKKERLNMQLSRQTLSGLRQTSQSVAEIVRILLASGAPFVLTSHMNQDPLEQLFGHCRHKGGANSNLNVAECGHAINSIRTVSTQAVSSARGNTAACQSTLDFSTVPKRRK